MSLLLAAHGVARTYGRLEALAPTDLTVRPGEVVALVGPNGAGKSTLLAILAGALPATGGTVELGPAVTRVGWAPQRPAQYGHLSARENLELFARLTGLDDPDAAASAMLERMGLPAGPGHASQLSVGNQQRLNLGLGLLGEPSVLLLDEPTASLDPEQRRRLWQLLGEVREREGAVLFATHSLEEVARFASRVAVLLEGRIVFEGAPAELDRATPEVQGT
ncbi:MAG: ABC transporter ATP-binding protein [Gaiella sp.]|nr:ABC transporter ATP-binding protein [Gaiella sp.]